MDHQAGPSAAMRLFDLPELCLHHIVSFMDRQTKLQFFRTCKGSHFEPGSAVLVLRASKLQCTYTVQRQGIQPRPALRSLLHWAAQISRDIHLTIVSERQLDNDFVLTELRLLDVLHSLLLYPDARASRSGHAVGRPAIYPGITSLTLQGYRCASLIPGLVADAFPNLYSITTGWTRRHAQLLGPVVKRGLSSVRHIAVQGPHRFDEEDEPRPAALRHIAQQLSHMPSLISIEVDDEVLQRVAAPVLAQLRQLTLWHSDGPTAEGKAALKACSQLEYLQLSDRGEDGWVQALPSHVPSIRALYLSSMNGEHMPSLLALPHLTSLTVSTLSEVSDDYSSAPCSWKHFGCSHRCSGGITKLPLHSLVSRVQCNVFELMLSDHAADVAAIRAAKPQLLRLAGIQIRKGILCIATSAESAFTKEQAAEVLAEWAPCWSGVTSIIICGATLQPIIEDALARLWPDIKPLVLKAR